MEVNGAVKIWSPALIGQIVRRKLRLIKITIEPLLGPSRLGIEVSCCGQFRSRHITDITPLGHQDNVKLDMSGQYSLNFNIRTKYSVCLYFEDTLRIILTWKAEVRVRVMPTMESVAWLTVLGTEVKQRLPIIIGNTYKLLPIVVRIVIFN